MLGEIVSYNDDFAVISYSGASFYYAYRRDPDGGANNIGPLKYPSGYEDSGVLFADIDFVFNVLFNLKDIAVPVLDLNLLPSNVVFKIF